jgi:hypothetical protein
VLQQDTLAQAEGEIVAGLIQVYRALGGGWQIRLQNCAELLPPPGSTPMPAQPNAEQLPPGSTPATGAAPITPPQTPVVPEAPGTTPLPPATPLEPIAPPTVPDSQGTPTVTPLPPTGS